MKTNVGCVDRLLRVILGTGLLVAWYVGYRDTMWLLIGVVPLLTGLFAYCPIYAILGIDTGSMKK